MFYLPSQPGRACLVGFWLAITALMVFLIIILSLWVAPKVAEIGIVATLILSVVGLCCSNLSRAAYTFWSRAAHVIGHFSHIMLLRICFDVVFPIVGWTTSSLMRLQKPTCDESIWVSRETLPAEAYMSQHKFATAKLSSYRLVSSFVLWTVHSGDLLPCCLVPFLTLLRPLIPKQESKISTDLYTLY